MTSTTAPARANRFGGKCARCAVWVPENAGVLLGSRGAYRVEHAGECPAAVATSRPANAAPGYYVRPADGKAVVVVQSKRNADRTYGKVLNFPADGSRPSWDYTPGAGFSVADLRPLTASDAASLGLSHGYCIRCCAPLGGETLSAAVSALVGYGETCSKRMGWAYPKGVKAQRAYLVENGS
jgi:hypothetical protein